MATRPKTYETGTFSGFASDWRGEEWVVYARWKTGAGFDLVAGTWVASERGSVRGIKVPILTIELAHYLSDYSNPLGALPAYPRQMRSFRRAIGSRWTWDNWWEERRKALSTDLTLEAFCFQHGCSIAAATTWKQKWQQEDTGLA
ncbi:hypothetical protein [uncultured Xylophilus sp.]|uniref:hypothetical protein n=1 Tax=uncultured Xylophilus sp. TaxID=296832 RepID=UPI0025FEF76E|nr:hypothetical protein [uncultured Xylophilus sp.]